MKGKRPGIYTFADALGESVFAELAAEAAGPIGFFT
jgi:hypothetical protein